MSRTKLFVAIAAVLLLTACASADRNLKKSDASTKSSVVSGEARSTTSSTTNAAPKASKVEITAQGFTQLPPNSIDDSYVSYGAVIRNPSTTESARSVSVRIAFYNAAGSVVGVEEDSIAVILPGASAAIGDDRSAQGVTRMEVQALVGEWAPAKSVGSFTVDGVSTSRDDFGDPTTTGTVRSTFATDLKDVKAVAIYRNSAGAVIGGDFTYVDFVPANGSAAFEISGSETVNGIATTEAYVTPSFLSL